MEKLEPMLAAIPEPEAAFSTQWGYLPLVAINVTFDYATMIFGGAGTWMRTEWGRWLLGLSGAAMILVAAQKRHRVTHVELEPSSRVSVR